MTKARADFDKGEYRWVAEVMKRAQRGASADAYEQLGYQALAGAVVSLAAPRTPKPFIDAILYGQKVTVAFFGFVEPRKQINKPLRQLLPSARF